MSLRIFLVETDVSIFSRDLYLRGSEGGLAHLLIPLSPVQLNTVIFFTVFNWTENTSICPWTEPQVSGHVIERGDTHNMELLNTVHELRVEQDNLRNKHTSDQQIPLLFHVNMIFVHVHLPWFPVHVHEQKLCAFTFTRRHIIFPRAHNLCLFEFSFSWQV